MNTIMNNPTHIKRNLQVGLQSQSTSAGFTSSSDDSGSADAFDGIPNLDPPCFSSQKFLTGSERKLIGSDSGFSGSTFGLKKTSRWVKMSESLLHKDVKKFLKKNRMDAKKPKETGTRNSLHRSLIGKKFYHIEDDSEDDEFECNAKLAQNAMNLKADKKAAIAKNKRILSESISKLMIQI